MKRPRAMVVAIALFAVTLPPGDGFARSQSSSSSGSHASSTGGHAKSASAVTSARRGGSIHTRRSIALAEIDRLEHAIATQRALVRRDKDQLARDRQNGDVAAMARDRAGMRRERAGGSRYQRDLNEERQNLRTGAE